MDFEFPELLFTMGYEDKELYYFCWHQVETGCSLLATQALWKVCFV